MSPIVIEDRLLPEDVDIEDSGRAKIALLCDEKAPVGVRILSVLEEDDAVHEVFDSLIGKKLRITIEVIGE